MGRRREGAAPATAAPKPSDESAFERLSHRRHFDVLGRKLKGTSVNVAHARSEANEKRKRTLLQEYRRHGKAGGFIDRRFGETDASTDADEKALQRMQRLRQMQFGKASRFALADDGYEEVLTHLGSSLADLGDDDFVPSDGDEDEELNDLITREYHFGGGLFTQKRRGDGEAPEDGTEDAAAPSKSKKEVMLEIIAKSKSAKRERMKEKEEDDEQLDALDLTFKALAEAGALKHSLRTSSGHLKVAKHVDRRRKNAAGHAADEEEDDFDALASQLAHEARASRVADRLKTSDELAAETAAQLEELERRRLKRMRQRGSDDDASGDDEDAPKGGYAAKRAKRSNRDADGPGKKARKQTGDDLDGNYALAGPEGDEEELSDDEVGSSGEDDEEGSDEDDDAGPEDDLRQSFKKQVGAMNERGDFTRGLRRLRRLGILKDGGDAGASSDSGTSDGSEDADEGEEDEEDEEDEEGGDTGEEDAEADDDAEPDSAEVEPAAAAAARAPKKSAHAARLMSHEAALPKSRLAATARGGELPFTYEAPATHAEFLGLVKDRTAIEMGAVIERVCACNAIALAPDNRQKLQVFFGVLLVHFEALAQQAPPPQEHLDMLVHHLLALSREVPFFSATAARARLERMQRAIAASLADGAARWPQPRSVMLLQLFSLMFPASDFRHPVLTPMAVLLGQYLAHCEVRSGHDAAVGVLVAALAVRLAQDSRRIVPEAVAFLSALVHCAAEDGAAATAGLPAHQVHQFGTAWLQPMPAGKSAKRLATAPVFSPVHLFQRPADDPYFDSAELRAAALHCALQTLASAADGIASASAGVALLAPCCDAVVRLTEAACSRHIPQNTLTVAASVVAAHARAASAVHPPLQLHTRKREPIRTFNPRFEEDGYVKGRDYDIDRERAEARSLKKQIAREAKGAARELRKDNRFLAEERTRALQVDADERESKYRATMAFLEQQQADFKSGGQGGGMKRKKK